MEVSNNNETYEDYLKAIYLISKEKRGGWVTNSEISNFLKVKPSSVSGMLHKLKENGFISWKPRSSIRLTSDGKTIAKEIINNNKKLRDFFREILKIHDPQLVEKLSCAIEHHITKEVAEALDNITPVR